MFKLYADTEKELFFSDYKPLPDLDELNCTQLTEFVENLYSAADNASVYGSSLLELALYDDIIECNKKRCLDYILTVSSGAVARIINSSKYKDIDLAIHCFCKYLDEAEEDELFGIGTDPGNIEKLLLKAYTEEKGKHDQ